MPTGPIPLDNMSENNISAIIFLHGALCYGEARQCAEDIGIELPTVFGHMILSVSALIWLSNSSVSTDCWWLCKESVYYTFMCSM